MSVADMYVIAPPKQPAVAIDNDQRLFPVRRIFCVGRNYADHVREMGNDPSRDLPFFFSKPADAVVGSGLLPFPSRTAELHHEVELVVALQGRGTGVSVPDAAAMIFGSAVGIDLTRRDLQADAKKADGPGTWPRALIVPRPSDP